MTSPTQEQVKAPDAPMTQDETIASIGNYAYGWSDADEAGANARRGVDEDVVRNISALKSEPEWMLKRRLKALRLFDKKPMPHWGADLSDIDFDNIKYFVRSTEKQATSWKSCPRTSRTPTTAWASRRRRSSASWRASRPSTSPRWSTTRSVRTSRSRA
ncbi:hypothetical protein [Georgenia yuyongxinii]